MEGVSQFACSPHGFPDDNLMDLMDFQENSAAISVIVDLECFAIKRIQ